MNQKNAKFGEIGVEVLVKPLSISTSKNYRPDVDGLRAVAVVGVILFHTSPDLLSGGFVGVDIFFVISGFVITSSISRELAEGSFSFLRFYFKRSKRLFPALFCTVFLTWVIACVLFLPNRLIETSNAAVASIFSVANIFFYISSGYWETDAAFKPLLHMWSLSVEEQFYIVWPALLVFIFQYSYAVKKFFFIVLAVMGFAVCEYTVRLDGQLAFFLTPFRVGEFAVGALLSNFSNIRYQVKKFTAFRETLWVLGFVLIIVPMVKFDQDTLFPGLSALAPCLGTALMISARGILSRYLLENIAVIWLGLLSYSLYLIHWPVIVFFKSLVGSTFDIIRFSPVIWSITLLLSVALHYLIERPFRYKVFIYNSNKWLLPIAGTTFAASLFVYLPVLQNGWPWRLDNWQLAEAASRTLDEINDERNSILTELCPDSGQEFCGRPIPGKENILILGDSHAIDGLNILREGDPNANYILMGAGGCPPFFDLKGITYSNKNCSQLNQKRFSNILSLQGFDRVVLSTRVSSQRLTAFEDLIEWLNAHELRVDAFGAGPQYSVAILDLAADSDNLNELQALARANQIVDQFKSSDVLKGAIERLGETFYDKREFFCPTPDCQILTSDGDYFVTYDQHHLSLEAAQEYGEFLSSTHKIEAEASN